MKKSEMFSLVVRIFFIAVVLTIGGFFVYKVVQGNGHWDVAADFVPAMESYRQRSVDEGYYPEGNHAVVALHFSYEEKIAYPPTVWAPMSVDLYGWDDKKGIWREGQGK